MEDDLNFLENVRQPQFETGRQLHYLANRRKPQYFHKWKMTSIFLRMEDNLDIFPNGI